MGNTVKNLMAVYFDSRWAPSVAASIVLIAFMAASLTTLKRIPLLVNSLLLLQGLSLIGMPGAAVWNFVKKRWRKGIVNLIMFPLVLTACFFGSSFFMFTSMLGPSGDGFADHLIIPEGIDLFEPKDRVFEAPHDGQTDVFQSNLLPSGAMKRGKPTFELFNSLQPGIYDSEIWINPGEPGMIYLKVYEVTGEQPLSANRLKERSNEWVGWSDDDVQLFLSNTQFTIYEGDWGNPYAARSEVWFVPDSGRPERKLLEKIYKIEGWQR
jgi:hypothetical protein